MTQEAPNPNYTREQQLQGLIEQLDDYINHYHGGSVELISFKDNKIQVRLGGACLGCPLSESTLHGWVEGTIRQFFPDIEKIENV